MRILVQRSLNSKVITKNTKSYIKKGMVVFVGFKYNDNKMIVKKMIDKLINLRIFKDEKNLMNLNLIDINGEVLSISQFTLYANTLRGNRPSFTEAMNYDKASELYKYFNNSIREKNIKISTGVFGDNMKVCVTNDGPITILLDSDNMIKNI